jgi:hypothetical protein
MELIELRNKIKGKNEDWIKKNYPNLHFSIFNIPHEIPWIQKVYYYFNNLTQLPKCYCGNDVKFKNGIDGWVIYCSKKCQANSNETKQKRIKTNLEKWGCENPMQNSCIKEIFKNNIIEKYGVDNISKLESNKNKVKLTNLEKFGKEYVTQTDKVRKSLSDLMTLKSQELNNIQKENLKNYIIEKVKEYDIIFNKILDTSIYEFIHKEHSFVIHKNMLNDRIKANITLCTECNKINSYSESQKELFNFIKQNYDGEIIFNYRKIIYPHEIDIYLPQLNIGFEYNGIFWHSDKFKDNNYHLRKMNKCIEKGIHLIQIWEDDFLFKKEIIKSRVLNILNKTPNKIWARKCEIKEIDKKISKNFLENNHIQGDCNDLIRLGLYYNHELVNCMTFSKLRISTGHKNKKDIYELTRYCNLINTNVVGGASKLMNYFIKNYEPKKIISYCDRFWSNGNLYTKLGFELKNITKPNYFYVIKNKRSSRFNWRKSELIKKGHDPNLTEFEIMESLGYNKVYDCGSFLYELDTKRL